MYNIKRISGYNQAARYFEETKKPRTVKWGEDERPLYNTRSYHYRIVKVTGSLVVPADTLDVVHVVVHGSSP